MNGVSVRDLVVTKNRYPAIAHADFDLPQKFCAVVTGPNGSGKTTLLKALSAVVAPSRGTITFSRKTESDSANIAITSANQRGLRHHIAYVGHTPLYMRHVTVQEHLELCAKLGRFEDTPHALDVESVIKQCRLEHRIDVRVDQLSAGQLRRLHFASAVVRSPSILCVDEPHASLDSDSKNLIDEIIASQIELGRNFIIATHDSQRTAEFATHKIEIQNGCASLVGAND